ncbi:MAG: carboxymuconolactone decarboxylase family protein [Planctomycetota bacterium]|jgi:AhpD family alkylhydroperoxidase
MALTSREKELVAVGTSVAAGCRPCTTYHMKAVRDTDATEHEVRRAVADADAVRRSAAESMRRHALEQLGGGEVLPSAARAAEPTRIGALVSIGAAFATSCTSGLERHLKEAQSLGISDAEVRAVVELAAFIRNKAASHVERLAGLQAAANASTRDCSC